MEKKKIKAILLTEQTTVWRYSKQLEWTLGTRGSAGSIIKKERSQ